MTGPVEADGDRLARLAMRLLGAGLVTVVLAVDGPPTVTGAASRQDPVDDHPLLPLCLAAAAHVIEAAAPLLVGAGAVPADASFGASPVAACAAVPLTGAGHVIGALCAVDPGLRHWSDDDVATLTDLAAMASSALTLRTQETSATRAQRTAEGADARHRLLLQLSEALAGTETIGDVAAAVTSLAARTMGTGWAALGLLDVMGRAVTFVPVAGGHGVPTDGGWAPLQTNHDHPTAHVVRTGVAEFWPDARSTLARYPGAVGTGSAAVAFQANSHLPLVVGGRVLGVLSLGWPDSRSIDTEERDVQRALAGYTAQAVNRATLLAERRSAAESLQLAMLTALPQPDHLELRARYVPASTLDEVGGDWYDAFLGPGGVTDVIIGDVTGHDLRAAAAMGQLRSLLRGFAVDRDESPGLTVHRLDRAVQRLEIGTLATLVLGRIEQDDADRASGLHWLRWTNAGHPPPLLLHPDGVVQVLDEPANLLVGLDAGRARDDHRTLLPSGSTLLLYTDGLIERRGIDLDDAVLDLADQLSELGGLPLDDLLAELVEQARSTADDDIAVLGVRLHPQDRPRPAEAGPADR